MLRSSIELIRDRSKNYSDVIENAKFFIKQRPIVIEQEDLKIFNNYTRELLKRLTLKLKNVSWSHDNIEEILKLFIETEAVKFHEVAKPLRLALIGEKSSPSIAEVIYLLGKNETVRRLDDILFGRES